MPTDKKRIIVCGSRSQNDYDEFCEWMREFLSQYEKDSFLIISGAAYYGCDAMVALFCEEESIENIEMPADWDKHGASAGHIRNHEMRKSIEFTSDPCVLAFWDGLSPGSAEMIDSCMSSDIHTTVVMFTPRANKDMFGYVSKNRRRR